MRWLIEDLFVCTAYQMSPIFRFPTTWYKSGGDSLVALLYGFQFTEVFYYENWPAWNTIMTFWFGVVARSIAFVALNVSNREKMGLPTYTAEFMEWMTPRIEKLVTDLFASEEEKEIIRSTLHDNDAAERPTLNPLAEVDMAEAKEETKAAEPASAPAAFSSAAAYTAPAAPKPKV